MSKLTNLVTPTNLAEIYDVFDGSGQFVMSAPLMVLSAVLRLHDAAVHRIVAETKDGAGCDVHFNNHRPLLNLPKVNIMRHEV